MDSDRLRNGRVLLWWMGLPSRRMAGTARSPARNDDAHLARDLRGLRLQRRGVIRRVGHAALVGALVARDDHAPWALDGDALDLAGAGRAQRAREATAEYGDAHRRWSHRGSCD